MADSPPLHIVLYQPEIPQNTGNIGRTCVAVGATLWLVRPLGFRLDEQRLRRAGLDYWDHLDCRVVDHWSALRSQLAGTRMWYFTRHASRPYTEVQYRHADVLVFGSETQGLPGSICDPGAPNALRIPTRKEVRSLNISNCVAIATYEALRQQPRQL
jgi:tRNA (cytidine/uridine-2'-O-)-methyltransferase